MKTIYKRTTQKDQELAEGSVPYLKKAISKDNPASDKIEILVKHSGETIQVPKRAYLLLIEIVELMAQGKSIHLLPGDSELSSQQAADILNISRPYLVKLLENGEIPFTKTGTHRRVKLSNVIEYNKVLKRIQRKNLDLLAKQAQELNLGY